ncbi:hypothetical protein [Pelagibacterium xiamenense]|uniref:hypothetical protein n=1 Tax=Pelagibacterium xiamenense TaxID=2901140 RepID=UPI001E5EC8F1|nr:hypothetical protein [Pelagibacterium xiamenense]MCD7060037.1 hypothetical protein [Pelagibacterium xiamenense]
MKTNLLLASATLVGALAAGTAFAQTPIGTITVSDQDLPYVAQYCEEMGSKSSLSDAFDVEPSLTAELATPNVQISSISYSDCQKAGLI